MNDNGHEDGHEEHSWLMHERRNNPNPADVMMLILEQNRQIADRIDGIMEWQRVHDIKSCELLAVSAEVQEIIGYRRWMQVTQKIIIWLGAAILGTLLFYHNITEEISKFTKP